MSVSSITDELGSVDFTSIDDLDPSLADGLRSVFDREVPMEIRSETNGNLDILSPMMESIRVRVFTHGSDETFSCIRIELSSETDLFFHNVHSFSLDTFESFKAEQKLTVDFFEFPGVLIRMLNAIIKDPKIFLAVLSLHADGTGKLDFIQNMDYKYVDLLTLPFKQSEEDVIQRQITFRYNSLKQKYAIVQSRLHEMSNTLKTKNPSLLLQIQKANNGSIQASSGQRKDYRL